MEEKKPKKELPVGVIVNQKSKGTLFSWLHMPSSSTSFSGKIKTKKVVLLGSSSLFSWSECLETKIETGL